MMLIIYAISLAYAGFVMGEVASHKTRVEVKRCAIEEVKTNHVSAEEAIMRCR